MLLALALAGPLAGPINPLYETVIQEQTDAAPAVHRTETSVREDA